MDLNEHGDVGDVDDVDDVTQVNKKRKRRRKSENRNRKIKMMKYDEGGMTVSNYQKAMTMERFSHGNDLNRLSEHFSNIEKKSNKMRCEVCGNTTYWKCMLCNGALCATDGKRKWNGKCMFTFHNPLFWGLARCDSRLFNLREADWVAPKEQERKRNEDKVASLKIAFESCEE